MERTERLIRTWMISGRDNEIQELVSVLQNGEATLLDVVKALGEYLTSEEDVQRTKGVEVLSLVINRLPAEKINRQSTRVLVTFYCGKLEDPNTAIPALNGLLALASLPTFGSTDTLETVNNLFKINMKAHIQSTRHTIFSIMDSLVARNRETLKSMGSEFLRGYIALAENEKDPRNLTVAFAIARVLCIEFDISNYTEDMFNITFCYFPITFKPPPDDPYGITTDDLKKSLLDCLGATPHFGLLAIPLFLEKITAGSPQTKRDALKALSSCLPVYGPGATAKFGQQLWNSLKLEIFQPVDDQTEMAALDTTRTFINVLCAAGSELGDVPDLAKEICDEALEVLREPEKSQAKPAIKVLATFLRTNPITSRYASSQTLPFLLSIFNNAGEQVHVVQILQAYNVIVVALDITTIPEDAPILQYKDDLYRVYVSSLKRSNTIHPSIVGLKILCQSALFDSEELGSVVHEVNELIGSPASDDEETRQELLDLLTIISGKFPSLVEQTTLPLLFGALPDRAPLREDDDARLKTWRVLRLLAKLCVVPALFETFVIRISTKLDLACSPTDPTLIASDPEATAAYAHALLQTLLEALKLKISAGHNDIPKFINSLVPQLFHLFIHLSLAQELLIQPKVVSVAAEVITLVVQTAPPERQSKLVKILSSAFYSSSLSELAVGHRKIPDDAQFAPFEARSSAAQKDLVVLFSAAVVALHNEVIPSHPELVSHLVPTLEWCLSQAESEFLRSETYHMLASIVNKQVEASAPFINHLLDVFWTNEIRGPSTLPQRRRTSVQMWAWIGKALLVRKHEGALPFINRLFDLFVDPEIGRTAAQAIGGIAARDNVLTKDNHAVIRMLFAQRYFNSISSRLIEGAKDQSDRVKQTSHLVALVTLTNAIPKSIFASSIPTLVPHFLRAMGLLEDELKVQVIDVLIEVLESPEHFDTITNHASTFVAYMLSSSRSPSSPALRIAALRLLGMLPKVVRYDVLHPHKATVLRELGASLDDPIRSVRKAAVVTRSVWFTFKT